MSKALDEIQDYLSESSLNWKRTGNHIDVSGFGSIYSRRDGRVDILEDGPIPAYDRDVYETVENLKAIDYLVKCRKKHSRRTRDNK